MKNWTTTLDKITEQSFLLFGTLSEEQLNWKPDVKTWSIGQNLEHLIVVNETYYSVFKSLKQGTYKTPFISKIGFMVSFFGKTVLNAVKPDRKKKMKTFPIWEPGDGKVNTGILERFEKHQKELKQQMEGVKEFVAKGTIISSPANRNIVYTLETAFDIIVSHEQRHIEQAKEVFELLRNKTHIQH